MLLQTCWDKGGASSLLHWDRSRAGAALQWRRSRYHSECRKQQFSCALPVTFGHPSLWLPKTPFGGRESPAGWQGLGCAAGEETPLAAPGQGLGCAAGEETPLASRAVWMAPLPLILPLAGRASAPREGAAAGPASRLAAICCSSPTSPSANEPVAPAQEGGEGLEKKSEGEKKSPFLGGAVNSEAFVCPCPPAPAGRRWEQGELIRQLGNCREAGGS